jgi:type IV pilus assembly protein PilP
MKMRVALVCFIFGFILFITGCSGGGDQDLIKYMQEVHQRPAKPIEPIPSFPEYRSFTYSAAGTRSPFDLPAELVDNPENAEQGRHTDVKPDLGRPKEYLENFSISAISMVGTISKSGGFWALVNDGTANVHRVTIGNYMGRNHGRIVGITNNQINLVEIVPDGGNGWVERPKTMKLVESKDR